MPPKTYRFIVVFFIFLRCMRIARFVLRYFIFEGEYTLEYPLKKNSLRMHRESKS
jgi:hypothetical protein